MVLLAADHRRLGSRLDRLARRSLAAAGELTQRQRCRVGLDAELSRES